MFRKHNPLQQCVKFISKKLAKSTHFLYFIHFAHSCIHIILYKLKYVCKGYLKKTKYNINEIPIYHYKYNIKYEYFFDQISCIAI